MSFTSDTLIFSDLHAHQWTEFAELVKYRGSYHNSRLVQIVRALDQITRRVEAKKIRRVVFGGDLFHRKRIIDVPVFNMVAQALWRMARHCERIYLLAGNHDLAKRSGGGVFTEEHALCALASHKRIQVIDQPTVIDGWGFVPYAADRDTFMSAMDVVHQAKTLLLHAGVAGAKAGPLEFQPLEPVSLEDIPDAIVYSGHYHKPQRVGHVLYIGAPVEHTRGDAQRAPRGYLTRAWDHHSEEAHTLHAIKAPRFIQLDFSGLQQHGEALSHNFIDVSVMSKEEAEAAHKIARQIGIRGFNLTFVAGTQRVQSRLNVQVAPGELPSLEALCSAYIQRAGSNLRPKRLAQMAKEALANADAEKG